METLQNFQLFSPLCPFSTSSCPHLVGVAVGLGIFWIVRCPKTQCSGHCIGRGQTDCSEEIFALVDGCQSWGNWVWQQVLSWCLLQTHPDAKPHPLTNMGKYVVVSAVTGKMVPLRDTCHCLFKHSLGQGVPQEKGNPVRGWTKAEKES